MTATDRRCPVPASPPAPQLLGEVIAWTCPGVTVTHAALVAALRDAGLDAGVARELAPRHAFTRACKKLSDQRIIRQVGRGRADRQVPVHRRDAATATGSSTTWRPCSPSTSRPARSTCDLPGLATLAQEELDRCDRRPHRGRRHPGDPEAVRAARRPVPDPPAGRVLLRARQRHAAFVDQVQALLGRLNGQLLRFPVPAGTAEGDRSVKEAVAAGLAALIAEHRQAVAAFGDGHPRRHPRAGRREDPHDAVQGRGVRRVPGRREGPARPRTGRGPGGAAGQGRARSPPRVRRLTSPKEVRDRVRHIATGPTLARHLLFVTTPALWPAWPFLPVVRRTAGARNSGCCSTPAGRRGLTGYSATVFAREPVRPAADRSTRSSPCPKEVFDTRRGTDRSAGGASTCDPLTDNCTRKSGYQSQGLRIPDNSIPCGCDSHPGGEPVTACPTPRRPDQPGGAVHGTEGGNPEPDREPRRAQLGTDNAREGTLIAVTTEPANSGSRAGSKRARRRGRLPTDPGPADSGLPPAFTPDILPAKSAALTAATNGVSGTE